MLRNTNKFLFLLDSRVSYARVVAVIAAALAMSMAMGTSLCLAEGTGKEEDHAAHFDPFNLKSVWEPFAPSDDASNYHEVVNEYIEKLKQKQFDTNTLYSANEQPLKPLVIVPSLIGNQIDAKLHRDHAPKIYCRKTSDWYRLYLNHEQETPFLVNCIMSDLAMEYNNKTRTFSPIEGVTTRIPYFGGVQGVRYLDGDGKKAPAWNEILNVLQDVGYTPGKNVRAATYDWRVGPTMYPSYFQKLKNLIEETSHQNGDQKVAVTALSMGCPVFALFLNRYVDQSWKDKYIDSYTSLSGVYGGSTWATLSAIGGFQLPSIGVDSDIMHNTLQSMGSMSWLFPYPSVFQDKPIVMTPSRNYSAATKDTLQLLRAANSGKAAEILQGMEHFRYPFDAPGVPTSCVMGYNISTPASLRYDHTPPHFKEKPQIISEDGDGTVLSPSLEVCAGWKGQQSQPVDVVRVPNMVHADALYHPEAIRTLLDHLLPNNNNYNTNNNNSKN